MTSARVCLHEHPCRLSKIADQLVHSTWHWHIYTMDHMYRIVDLALISLVNGAEGLGWHSPYTGKRCHSIPPTITIIQCMVYLLRLVDKTVFRNPSMEIQADNSCTVL